MLAASLLLLIAVMGGTLLTFLYDGTAPFPARLAMGVSTGLALMATVGFLFALRLGLGAASIGPTAAVTALPFLLLFRRPFRDSVARKIRTALTTASEALRHPTRETVAYILFYCLMAIVLGLLFGRAVYENPGGIFTGVRNNLGDLTLHLQVINSFSQGHNFPPEDPTYAGVRFAYPFLVDFLAAMLVRCGADVIQAMWIQNMVLSLALVGLVHYWTLLVTRNRLAGLIAPVLLIFSGGLGWVWILQEVHNSDGLIPLLEHLPHDYTIFDNGPFRWGNSLTTLFVTQRSILFGMPLAISIFCLWWKSIPDGSLEEVGGLFGRSMVAAGLLAGLLPLIHSHTFLVVMGVGGGLALLFPRAWKGWLRFFVLAGIVALPQVLWLAGAGGVALKSYIGWQPGWDHGNLNPVLFWLLNTGLFIPLLLLGLFWNRPDSRLPKKLLKYYAPFLVLCFIVPNLIKLAPSVWDNIKVLIYWYVASTPLVALVLAGGWGQATRWKRLSAAALAAMILAGGLDIWRVIAGETEYREFDVDGIAIAHLISRLASPRALVLHAPTYDTPVFLTGRRSLLGYPGWMWSRGLDYSQRQAQIQRMYAGAPDAETLIGRYQVDYVLIGPQELAFSSVNPEFWSRYPKVAEIGQYRLYSTNFSEERAPR